MVQTKPLVKRLYTEELSKRAKAEAKREREFKEAARGHQASPKDTKQLVDRLYYR